VTNPVSLPSSVAWYNSP